VPYLILSPKCPRASHYDNQTKNVRSFSCTLRRIHRFRRPGGRPARLWGGPWTRRLRSSPPREQRRSRLLWRDFLYPWHRSSRSSLRGPDLSTGLFQRRGYGLLGECKRTLCPDQGIEADRFVVPRFDPRTYIPITWSLTAVWRATTSLPC